MRAARSTTRQDTPAVIMPQTMIVMSTLWSGPGGILVLNIFLLNIPTPGYNTFTVK